MSVVHNLLLILLFLVYLWDVCWVGRVILRWIRIDIGSNIEKVAYSFAIGNLLISIIIHYLGILHIYRGELIFVIYIFPLLFLFKEIPLFISLLKVIRNTLLKVQNYQVNLMEALIFAFLLFLFIPLVPHIFGFPTSWDALAYHLTLPKVFLKDHYFPFYEWLPNSLMPIGIEALFSFGEIFHEPRLANFVVFSFIIILTLYLLYGLRYMYSRLILFFALFIFLFRNMLSSQASITPFVDYPLAFYGLMIGVTLIKHIKRISPYTLLLLFVLSFFTFLIKYGLGIIFILSTTAILIVHFLFNRSSYSNMIRSMSKYKKVLLILALLFFITPILYWMVRNFIYVGNPVYPFYNPLWNQISPVWNYDESSYREQIAETKSGTLNLGVIKNMLAGVKMNFSIEEAIISFLPIFFSMFGLLSRDSKVRYLSLFALIAVVMIHWSIGYPSYRYSMSAVVILALVSSIVFNYMAIKLKSLIRIPFILIFIAILLIQTKDASKSAYKFFFNNFTQGITNMISYESAVAGLFAQDNYKNIDYINRSLDKTKDKVLILFDNRLYYFDVPVEFDVQSKKAIFADKNVKNADEVYDRIKKREITYLFVNNNWGYYADLRKDLLEAFINEYTNPVSTLSGTVVYKIK